MEVEELEEEVRQEDVGDGSAKRVKGVVTPAAILQQLSMLRGDLGGLAKKVEGGTLEGEGEKEEPALSPLAQKAQASSSLLAKLGLSGGKAEPASPATTRTTTKAIESREIESEAELEKRIAEMEKMLGVNEADIDEVRRPGGLISFALIPDPESSNPNRAIPFHLPSCKLSLA